MPSIKSDLTNKTLPNNRLREIEIPDESGGPQEFEGNSDLDLDAMNALMASRNMPPVDPKLVSAFNQRQMAKRQNVTEEELDLLEQQITKSKGSRAPGQERLNQGAKQRIEMLCGISRNTKEVDLNGTKYVLRTLKGKEQRAIMMAAAQFEMTVEFPFELRKQVLAHTLIEVAGTDTELFLSSSSFEAKLNFIEELDDVVLNRLYNEYLLLVKDAELKFGLKTQEDMKEVVEDLKK